VSSVTTLGIRVNLSIVSVPSVCPSKIVRVAGSQHHVEVALPSKIADTSDVPYKGAVHCHPQPMLCVSLVTPIIHNLEKERESEF